MASNLVIVESPAKAGTIQKFLGKDFIVKSSFGHIRDLHSNKISIDIDNNFMPEYIIPDDKKKVVSELKKLAEKSGTVWLASDEDREGEAIAWHLSESLGLNPETTKRIVFHEITKNAILDAIENPRGIDTNLVNAQQARRILDRLVGFELSPVLWRKIQPRLSAGRVQSVALRLVVDREREIINFRRQQYYSVSATFIPEGMKIKIKGIADKKFEDIESARKFLSDCADAVFRITRIDKKEGIRHPAPPFTTSTLQQDASRKLRFSVSKTMMIAQQLYEKGLITYMRTDSTNLSSLAIGTAKNFIIEKFGQEYSQVRNYKTKSKGAQEAHEAIRPTHMDHESIDGSQDEQKLYSLIWHRTIASQMSDARILKTEVSVGCSERPELFLIKAEQINFDGFLKVYMESSEEEDGEEILLPELKENSLMENVSITAENKFTNPPYRYSEASLVKKLEELGIGRPSTYAPTITTLTTGRGYLYKGNKEGIKVPITNLELKNGVIREIKTEDVIGEEKGRLLPQEIGMIVTDYLVENFSDILDYDFTANVEKDFDKIADGKMKWNNLIASFYKSFHEKITEASENKNFKNVSREIGTDPVSGMLLIAKNGPYGPYIQKGEGEARQVAKLAPGQLIESITIEEALKLFELPRVLGKYNEEEIIVTKGRFGPYIKVGSKNISIPRNTDIFELDLERAAKLIEDSEKQNSSIAEWKEEDIKVLNGRFGPYIKHKNKNFKIPKGKSAELLTLEECKQIIESTSASKKISKRRK